MFWLGGFPSVILPHCLDDQKYFALRTPDCAFEAVDASKNTWCKIQHGNMGAHGILHLHIWMPHQHASTCINMHKHASTNSAFASSFFFRLYSESPGCCGFGFFLGKSMGGLCWQSLDTPSSYNQSCSFTSAHLWKFTNKKHLYKKR